MKLRIIKDEVTGVKCSNEQRTIKTVCKATNTIWNSKGMGKLGMGDQET